MADTEAPREWRVILNTDNEHICKYEFGDDATTICCGGVITSVPETYECGINAVFCETQELKVDQDPSVFQVFLLDQRRTIRARLGVFLEAKQAADMVFQLSEWLSKVNAARLAHFYDCYKIVVATSDRLFLKRDGMKPVFKLGSKAVSGVCPFINARPGGTWYLRKHLGFALDEVCTDEYDHERFGFNRYSFSADPPATTVFFDEYEKSFKHPETGAFAPIRAHIHHHKYGSPEGIYIYEDGNPRSLSTLQYIGSSAAVIQQASKLNAMFDQMNAERLAMREQGACGSSESPNKKQK